MYPTIHVECRGSGKLRSTVCSLDVSQFVRVQVSTSGKKSKVNQRLEREGNGSQNNGKEWYGKEVMAA